MNNASELFDSIRSWFVARTPIAQSRQDAHQFFTSTGGCIGIEHSIVGDVAQGLLEAATPECRSPKELIAYQAAQDQQLTECLAEIEPTLTSAWIKNSSDAFENSYGQHENYEVVIASGLRLFAWRVGLVFLLPMLLLYRLLSSNWLLMIVGATQIQKVFASGKTDSSGSTHADYELPSKRLFDQKLSSSWLRTAAAGLRFLHWPLAIYLDFLVKAFVLIPHRRFLSGFLASRAMLDGAGYLDRQNRYWISSRAATTTCVIGFGRYWNERPIIQTGHWLRGLVACRKLSLLGWRQLFYAKQRIQITLGDSTPNPRTEYLRIGTTVLMLDLIETGNGQNLPVLKQLVRDQRALATDPSMLRTVQDTQGRFWTGISLQRYCACAVRQLLSVSDGVHEEAMAIVEQWQQTLDHLDECASDAESGQWLLGRVDWITKQWLIDRVAAKASWSERKKVDIRYHELSNRGYFRLLSRALQIQPYVEQSSQMRSRRLPPMNSPATLRGYWIREFSCDASQLEADWNSVDWIDEDGRRHEINLTS